MIQGCVLSINQSCQGYTLVGHNQMTKACVLSQS